MEPGNILFHKDFVFADGGSADKYLVVVGSAATHVVFAKTTSNGSRYRNDHGCQAGSYFSAFLLTRGCCCLPLNTWICLTEFYELTLAELHERLFSGVMRRYGTLDPSLARDVQVCAAGCDDISSSQEQVVRDSFVNVT
jgi:hypothetical protein